MPFDSFISDREKERKKWNHKTWKKKSNKKLICKSKSNINPTGFSFLVYWKELYQLVKFFDVFCYVNLSKLIQFLMKLWKLYIAIIIRLLLWIDQEKIQWKNVKRP